LPSVKALEGVQIYEQEMDELTVLLEYLFSPCLKTCFHFGESKDTYYNYLEAEIDKPKLVHGYQEFWCSRDWKKATTSTRDSRYQ